jgi:amino acid transporter
MYAGAPLAYGVLRNQLPDRERPYRLPGGRVIAPLSFVIASLIIYWAGWDTLWRLGVAIVLGYALLGSYAAYATSKGLPNAPKLDWRAAQWLPAYLVGMGIFSWQGGFCAQPGCGAQDNLPMWWDMLVISVFALVIYYWALAVGLKRADIERNIDEVAVVDGGGH